jgi:outer membrane protein TolC
MPPRPLKSSKSSGSRLRLAALVCAIAAGAVLSACATFSADGGFKTVSDAAHTNLGKDLRWPRSDQERAKRDAEVAALLAQPLEVDDAVQVALLNNHGLQAAFEELGVSEADLVQSGRVPNPRFTLRHSSANGVYNIEETLTFNLVALLSAPYVHATEQRRFAQVQSAVIIQVVQLADRTRTAYYTALAARDSLRYAFQVKDAAQTSAEIAHRMLGAGNWNRVDQAHQQSFYWQSMQDLSRAQLVEETSRADLAQLLGIAGSQTPVPLAEHLPELPQNIVELPDLETIALQRRIDLQLMRSELDELARRLKLSKATRFVNVLDVGPTRVREGTSQQPYLKGYEVSLEVPIFDTGDARVRKAEALYAQSVERFAQAAIDARAEVIRASASYRQAYIMAVRQRDDVMSVQNLVAKQDLLRYNASLISVFDLLADARMQITGVDDLIQRTRDFWIARSHLDTSLLANSSL